MRPLPTPGVIRRIAQGKTSGPTAPKAASSGTECPRAAAAIYRGASARTASAGRAGHRRGPPPDRRSTRPQGRRTFCGARTEKPPHRGHGDMGVVTRARPWAQISRRRFWPGTLGAGPQPSPPCRIPPAPRARMRENSCRGGAPGGKDAKGGGAEGRENGARKMAGPGGPRRPNLRRTACLRPPGTRRLPSRRSQAAPCPPPLRTRHIVLVRGPEPRTRAFAEPDQTEAGRQTKLCMRLRRRPADPGCRQRRSRRGGPEPGGSRPGSR